MGEVYRATDTKLDRDVALKVLPQAFTDDPDRLARFEREAKVLASLNHPNIGHIYGLEEAEGTRALVLELIEGPTLADRIAQGPIPIDEALPIAKQIAEALEAAHEAGVIHRDLKPANVKVKEDGTVKVLDFGLAKALDTTPQGDPSLSPTLTAAATQMGVIMGTAAYMSPEQARGKPVDKRADIWAFGAVLFEMLTGAKPFPGDDVSQTLARVIERDPDWEALPKTLPPALDTYLRRCLQRHPRERVRDIGDVRLALSGAFENAVEPLAPVGSRRKRREWLVGTVAALVAAGVAIAMWSLRPGPPPSELDHVSVALPGDVVLRPGGSYEGWPMTMSPDGRHLVYVGFSGGTSQLYHRAMDQLDAVPLPDTDGAMSPSFSPDGQWVAFSVSGALRRIPLAGGPPVTITELPIGYDARLTVPQWGPDNRIWFWMGPPVLGLAHVAATGGDPQVVTKLAEGERRHFLPHPLPGGQGVVFTVYQNDTSPTKVAVHSYDTDEHRVLANGLGARFVPGGHLVFVGLEGRLVALPFDADAHKVTGPPVTVPPTDVLRFHLSADGSLAYLPGGVRDNRTLVWVDRDGREDPIAAEPRAYRQPKVSPDGRKIVVADSGDGQDLWVIDLNRDIATRLTLDPAQDESPVWAPDGDRILFRSERDGLDRIYYKAADGTGRAEPLIGADGESLPGNPATWSADGDLLVQWGRLVGNSGLDIGIVSLNREPTLRPLLAEPYGEADGSVSPDGRWIAYLSNETGAFEVYVRPFPDTESRRWPITGEGGEDPRWSPASDELYYRSQPVGPVMAVPLTNEPGVAEPLFEDVYLRESGVQWDVAPDGRFLMIKSEGQSAADGRQINIVRNWHDELQRLVPTE